MITEVKTYLPAATEVLTLCETGIAEIRAGRQPAALARQIVRTLDKEARRHRQLAAQPKQNTDARKGLEALARDASRLKGEARKLC